MLQSIFGEANLKLKREFLFQLFVIFFVTVFCALGTWQLYRLQWKLELISEITFGLDSKPIEYSNSIKKNYQRVSAKGKFNYDKQIYLYSLNENGKPGYDVVTPFRTSKNENVLINRGWIKKELKNNIWFSINLDDLKETSGEQFNEFVIFLEDNQAKSPIPKKISIDVPNNHLKYAITWYAISISIIFYYLYFRRKK